MTTLHKTYRLAWHNRGRERDYIGRYTASLELARVWVDDAQTDPANRDRTFWIEESDDGGVTWQKCN